MSGSSAVPILCATCGLEIVGTMWWHESDPLNRYCERCGVPSPTPAAPAGSGEPLDLNVADALGKAEGWGTMSDEDAEEAGGVIDLNNAGDMKALAWCIEAHWQRMRHHAHIGPLRAARESAERERDTISCNAIPTWPACEDGLDRRQHNEPVCSGCYSAEKAIRREVESQLAASTEREAGLRALCSEAIGEYDRVQFAFDAADSRRAHIRKMRDEWRSRLASLAAPEGGTE